MKKEIESTIKVKTMKEREFAHFQFKVPHKLWSKFKIKTIEDNSPTYREKLIELIENYVNR
jgi:hypothetical protein